jgi:hypothetical protein
MNNLQAQNSTQAFMRKSTFVLLKACFAFAVFDAGAQTPGAVRQVESDQQRRELERNARPIEPGDAAPELYPGEVTDVGPQSILKYKTRTTYFEAFADAQYFYTDNMFLNEDDKQSADVLIGTAQFALAPTPYPMAEGKLAPRLGYRHQWYTFGLAKDEQVRVFDFDTLTVRDVDLNEFDFNAQTIFTDARWTAGRWAFEAGFDYTRLMDSDHYDQFYQEYVPRWGVQHLFPVSQTGTLSVGYAGDYRFADTDLPPPAFDKDFNTRTDHSLFVAYTQSLCKYAVVQPFYRFKYTRFTEGDKRDDYLHSFGLAVHCTFTPYIGLRAFAGYDILESSNAAIPDYKRLDAGAGLNLTFRF